MFTFGFLKKISKNILYPKKKLEDDYEISYSELSKGYIFPLYKWSSNPSLLINGFLCEDGKCYLMWQELHSVEIIPSAPYFTPMGGSIKLKAEAKYKLFKKDIYGNIIEENEYYHEITNPLFNINNYNFTINGNLLSVGENHNESENKVDVSISYRQSNIIKSETITITQNPNIISDWILSETKPQRIVIQSNLDIIPREGGIIDLTVIRHSTNYYHKEDSNGIVQDDKYEKEVTENITSLCTFTSFDNDVKIIGSHAIINKQKEESNARTITIMAKFAHLTASKEFYQESGGIVTFDYYLGFTAKKSASQIYELPTSVLCDAYIPISFYKNKYIDGLLSDKLSLPLRDLKLKNNESSWCSIELVKENNEILIHIFIKENGLKNNARTMEDIIIEGFGKQLQLTIIQPPLALTNIKPKIVVSGQTNTFNSSNIYTDIIEFIPYIDYIYEDDSIESIRGVSNEYHMEYELINNENIIVDTFWKSDFDGSYNLSLKVNDEEKNGKTLIKGKLFKNNEFIASSNIFDVFYEKKDIVIENNKDATIKVNVIVAKENINENIVSSESIMYIKDNNEKTLYTLFMTPCWLYEGINEDIIYKGNVILQTNQTYYFITNGFSIKIPTDNKNYNFNEKIPLTESDKEITLFIDL